jgi:hypothetical protein
MLMFHAGLFDCARAKAGAAAMKMTTAGPSAFNILVIFATSRPLRPRGERRV